MLASEGRSTDFLLNRLLDKGYDDLHLIAEFAPSKLKLLRQRMRRLGIVRALGQGLFMVFVPPVLKTFSKAREREIIDRYKLEDTQGTVKPVLNVTSINDPQVPKTIQTLNPDLVLVNGTSIIRQTVIDVLKVPMVNTHLGITPAYRGVHGGYWALRNGEPEMFGATLHLIDKGVDTGAVLAQPLATPGPADNFVTYPILQQAVALTALENMLQALEAGTMPEPVRSRTQVSRQWYHPTIWEYVAGVLKGIW